MSATLQERLVPMFHFALNRGGFLVLGVAETVGSSTDLFEQVSRAHKIYRRKDSSHRTQLTFMADQWLPGRPLRPEGGAQQPDFIREADRLTLSRYAPPAVLVNQNFEVQQYRGRTSPFLEAPPGQPTASILRLAREGLFVELQGALNEAKAARSPVVRENLHVSDGGRDVEFNLRILPLTAAPAADPWLLVLFEASDLPMWPSLASRPAEGTPAERDAVWIQASCLLVTYC